jgi:hypothetical protein
LDREKDMALNGQAYAVDLDRMRAAVGSRDEQLLKVIVTYTDEGLDEDLAAEAYSARDAMVDIIEGEFRAPEHRRHLYGYAIEELCLHYGETIPIPEDLDIEIGDPGDLEIDTKLVRPELPIPVPEWGDTPYVRFLTASEVADEFKRLSNVDLSHDDPSIEEGRQILLYQLGWAADRERAFVTLVNG